MRRVIGFTLIALGAFAVVLGLMLRLYAYPNLARAELDGFNQSIAEGSGMTVFNPDAITDPDIDPERHNVNLVATRSVKGITTAPEAKPNGDVMVWEVGTVVMDRDNMDPEKPISVTQDRVCLDRRTSVAVHPCRNEYFKDPGRAEENQEWRGEHRGQNYKFPFGTERKTYPYFDTTVRKAVPAKYVAEETIEGVQTYRFEMEVPRTKLEEREIPGHLIGSDSDSVVAERYYENQRTLWVEPVTGIVVKGSDATRQTLEGPEGTRALTLMEGTMTLTEDNIVSNAKKAKEASEQLQTLLSVGPYGIGPWTLAPLGILLGLGGALLLWLRRPDDAPGARHYAERAPELVH